MPPKAKFTREEIIKSAVDIVREMGAEALTSRNLGKKLGMSSCPVFTAFENMEEVKSEVLKFANDLYEKYIKTAMNAGEYPPYKASGMAYIEFAIDEKELFKLLFMRDRRSETIKEDRDSLRPLLDIIMKNLSISEDEAYALHMELWIWVHGIATMAATSYLNWDKEFISRAITDAYVGLRYRFTKGKEECTP